VQATVGKELPAMNPIYHYTTADRLAMILEAGEITPSAKGVNFPTIPAVWADSAPRLSSC